MREAAPHCRRMETPSFPTSLQEASVLIKLIGNLPDSIYIKDATGRYVMDNAAHRRALGIAEESEVVGKTVYDFFPRELAERYHKDDEEVIRTGQLLLNREETLVDADGQRRWVRTTKVPLHDAAGKVTGLICIGRDITGRRQAEESLAIERDLLRTLINNLPENELNMSTGHPGLTMLSQPLRSTNTWARSIGRPRQVPKSRYSCTSLPAWTPDGQVTRGSPASCAGLASCAVPASGGPALASAGKLPESGGAALASFPALPASRGLAFAGA